MRTKSFSTLTLPNRGLRCPIVVGALIAICLSASVAAGDGWKVQGSLVYLEPGGASTSVADPAAPGTQSIDTATTGFSLSAEKFLTDRFSLEVGAQFADFDSDYRTLAAPLTTTTDTVGTYSLYLGADWHFMPRSAQRKVDWTVGVFVSQYNYDDVTVLAGTPQSITFRYDDDFGFGLKLGADISLGSGGWFVNTELRASTILLESEIAGEDIDLDPVKIAIGLGYRF